MKTNDFKETMMELLDDYIEVKKASALMGYDDNVLKFKDYIEYYLKLKEK